MTPSTKALKFLAALALASLLVALTGTARAEPKLRVIKVAVTAKGVEPGSIHLKKGEPVELRVTRTTDETCATELVLPAYQVNVTLPLNTAVPIRFTPLKPGTLKYGCAMGMMISGVLVIE